MNSLDDEILSLLAEVRQKLGTLTVTVAELEAEAEAPRPALAEELEKSLASVRSAVELHGGRTWWENTPSGPVFHAALTKEPSSARAPSIP